jgi:hypothetical protein
MSSRTPTGRLPASSIRRTENPPVIRSRSSTYVLHNHRFLMNRISKRHINGVRRILPRGLGERRMRSLLLILAATAAAFAIVSGVSGFPINAGLGVAVTMMAWLIADIIAHRQMERMRQGRERVWERREREQTTVTSPHEAGRTR